MFRPRVRCGHLAAAAVIAAVAAAACGSGHPEEAQVKQFFRASALRDDQTLANFAMVTFDPNTDGQVTSMSVESVSEPRVEPLKLRDLSKALEEAQAADKELTGRQKEYQDAHVDALKRVLAAEASGKKLTGADATVQTDWQKWRDQGSESAKKISDARAALQDAKPFVEMSLASRNGPPPDLETAEGQVESKDVVVDATVKAPDGSTAQKKLVVTMSRATIKTAEGEQTGKWIFTSVKPA